MGDIKTIKERQEGYIFIDKIRSDIELHNPNRDEIGLTISLESYFFRGEVKYSDKLASIYLDKEEIKEVIEVMQEIIKEK